MFFVTFSLVAKSPKIPEWVTDKNAVYPDVKYLSQVGIADKKDKAKTEAEIKNHYNIVQSNYSPIK